MKTTIDLPEDLVRIMKMRAVRDGRKLKDVAAEVLRSGLAARVVTSEPEAARIVKDRKTRLPIILCRTEPPRGQEMTPQRIADILTAQESEWANDLG